jgi:hypothetical protein
VIAIEGELVRRWLDLHRHLSQQLATFEHDRLTPRSHEANAQAGAIADLRRRVSEFDRLILGVSARVATPSRLARRASAPG